MRVTTSVDNDIDKTVEPCENSDVPTVTNNSQCEGGGNAEKCTEFVESGSVPSAEGGGQAAEPRVVNIHSKSKVYPEAELSNFYPHAFVVDGVECASMEGFLQSLKHRRASAQMKICRLVGGDAKDAGAKKRLWRWLGRVWWQGRAYRRDSAELYALVRRAYSELYRQNGGFRDALNSTRGATLTHDIGSHDPRKTILTEEEFISHLVAVRDGV